jgi:hypothetical protein
MYVFKNTTLLAYRSNRFREIRIIPRMYSYSIYTAVNNIPFYTEKPEITKLETILETHLKNTVVQQNAIQLFEDFYRLEGIFDSIDKDSTPVEIQRYTERDSKLVCLTENYLTEGGSPDSDNGGSMSLLNFSVVSGCVALAQLVVYHGADVNYGPVHRGVWVDDLPSTPPLELAVMTLNTDEKVVELLLYEGAHLPATDKPWSLQQMMAREQIRVSENIRGTVSCFPKESDKERFEKILVMLQAEPARRVNESKREAFAMVLHKRLGAGSRVSELDQEVVRIIVDRVR